MRQRSLALLVVLALLALAGASATREAVAHVGCGGKDVRFKAADGTKLVAHRWGAGRTAVVLAHEDNGNLCQWAPFAKALAARGYSAVAFDFRGYGESQYRTGRAAHRLPADVTAAVRLARARGATRVVVAGASMGGWAALAAAAVTKPAVAGAISVSTPADYLGNIDPYVRKLSMPLLFAAATGDSSAPADAKRMYDEAPSTRKALEVVPGTAHGVALVGTARVRGAIFEFLRLLQQ